MQAAAPGQEKSELHFCKDGVFFLSLLERPAGAGPHRAPPAGSRRDPTARRSPGGGERGVPATRGWLLRLPKGSLDPRQAEPRRRRLLPAQGVRGQRGSTLPGRTLSPGCLFKFGEVGPTPSKGAWGFGVNPWQAWRQTPLPRVPSGLCPARGRGAAVPQSTERAARALPAEPHGQGAPGDSQSPPKPRHHRHRAQVHVSPQLTEGQVERNAAQIPKAAMLTDNFCCRSYTDKIGNKYF